MPKPDFHGREHRPAKYGDATGAFGGGADATEGMLYLPSSTETDGQVLTRDSSTDHGMSWATPSSSSGTGIVRAAVSVSSFSFNNYAEVAYDTIRQTDDGSVFELASNRLRIKTGGVYMYDIGFKTFSLVAGVNTMVDFIVDFVATIPAHFWSNADSSGLGGPSYTGLMRLDNGPDDINGYTYPGVRGFVDLQTNTTLANDAVFKVTADWTEDQVSVSTSIGVNWLSVIRIGDTAWV